VNPLSVAAGKAHTCAVNWDGVAKCWGSDFSGQLGINRDNATVPQENWPVSNVRYGTYNMPGPGASAAPIPKIIAISAGNQHTCALSADGQVWCFGASGSGQLGETYSIGGGRNKAFASLVYTEVSATDRTPLTDVVAISAGDFHTCAVTKAGTVRCWGKNENGQLGDGSSGAGVIVVLPGSVPGLANITAISAGWSHTCAIGAGGQGYCWGLNTYGALGDNSTEQRTTPVQVVGSGSGLTSIAAGAAHTCATRNGLALCWGRGINGALGHGTITDLPYPSDATSVTFMPASLDAVSVIAGDQSSCAQLNGLGPSALRCWGSGMVGELGDGFKGSASVSVDTKYYVNDVVALSHQNNQHRCLINQSSKVFCWGGNLNNQVSGLTSLVSDGFIVPTEVPNFP